MKAGQFLLSLSTCRFALHQERNWPQWQWIWLLSQLLETYPLSLLFLHFCSFKIADTTLPCLETVHPRHQDSKCWLSTNDPSRSSNGLSRKYADYCSLSVSSPSPMSFSLFGDLSFSASLSCWICCSQTMNDERALKAQHQLSKITGIS